MSDTDDARRARGWREQYMVVSGPSVLLDAPHVIACGRDEWEPVPGAPGVPRLVEARLEMGACTLLVVRWVRRVDVSDE